MSNPRDEFRKIMRQLFPSVARIMAAKPNLYYQFNEEDLFKLWQASAREQAETLRKIANYLESALQLENPYGEINAAADLIDKALESFSREAGTQEKK